MTRLTRENLFTLAQKHGWERGKHLPAPKKQALVEELKTVLSNEVTMAPARVFDGSGGFREMTLDETVENLLEELV